MLKQNVHVLISSAINVCKQALILIHVVARSLFLQFDKSPLRDDLSSSDVFSFIDIFFFIYR